MIQLPENLKIKEEYFHLPEEYLILLYYDFPRAYLSWIENIPILVAEKDELGPDIDGFSTLQYWVAPVNEELLFRLFFKNETFVQVLKQVETEIWEIRFRPKYKYCGFMRRKALEIDFEKDNEYYCLADLITLEEFFLFLDKYKDPQIR